MHRAQRPSPGAHHDETAEEKLDELFHDTLKDIYFAEKKILATLPKMAKAAQSPDLKRPSNSIAARRMARPPAGAFDLMSGEKESSARRF